MLLAMLRTGKCGNCNNVLLRGTSIVRTNYPLSGRGPIGHAPMIPTAEPTALGCIRTVAGN